MINVSPEDMGKLLNTLSAELLQERLKVTSLIRYTAELEKENEELKKKVSNGSSD